MKKKLITCHLLYGSVTEALYVVLLQYAVKTKGRSLPDTNGPLGTPLGISYCKVSKNI
jgi:hypothetical protein